MQFSNNLVIEWLNEARLSGSMMCIKVYKFNDVV